jgi:8-oxo-dGTP pyrophosphatase MutT (NUDIX family)
MSDVAVPSKASTIIVAREKSQGGFEVLMTRRHQQLQFLGGYFVFPGGGMEEADYSERMLSRCRGLSQLEAQEKLGGGMSPDVALGYWVAAVRELFEETGVHFFVDQDNADAGPNVWERLAKKRQHLSEGRLNLPELLETEDLFCDLSRLTYLFHRITPEKHKVRFDTRFYLAAMPANQSPLVSSEEVAESLWLAPDIALNQSQSGTFLMMPPTIIALRTLAEHNSWDALRATFCIS